MKDHFGLILIIVGSLILFGLSRRNNRKFKQELERRERDLANKNKQRPLI
jgi:hypothetical protein